MRKIIYILTVIMLLNCKSAIKNKHINTSLVGDNPKDTVSNCTASSLKGIYPVEPYHIDNYSKNIKHYYQSFINFPEILIGAKNLINKTDLKKDTIYFSSKQRDELFKNYYSEKDSIFIYDLKSQTVKKQLIIQTPIMACINPYLKKTGTAKEKKDYNVSDYTYVFNLQKSKLNGFAAFGTENPFIENGLKKLTFEKLSQKQLNKNIKCGNLKKRNNDKNYKVYISEYKGIRFFVKNKDIESKDEYIYNWSDLIAIDTLTKESYHMNQTPSEGYTRAHLKLKYRKSKYDNDFQYVGKLFKNKPPVIFGLMHYSFSCEIIEFLDKKELNIEIECNNQH